MFLLKLWLISRYPCSFFLLPFQVEYIAASFVRTGDDVRNLKKLLANNGGSHIKIISKIENQEGLENYDDIVQETDAVMVARGDVSLNILSSTGTSQ